MRKLPAGSLHVQRLNKANKPVLVLTLCKKIFPQLSSGFNDEEVPDSRASFHCLQQDPVPHSLE